MPIHYILLVNKQGQTRLSQYFGAFSKMDKRNTMEADIVRHCLARSEFQCSFIEYREHKAIYRRYASLFFIVGADREENELAILEFIHLLVETFDSYFENVCELDIMFNLDKAHLIIQEALMNGIIVETNKINLLQPVQALDAAESALKDR
ncbi:MAG: AP-4 complex subunit sigma [archaeon]|nr:AP-4 complex subunit sigma [archaeon]